MNSSAKIIAAGTSDSTASGFWLLRTSRLDGLSNIRVHTRVLSELTLHSITKDRAQTESMLSRKSVDVRRFA